MWDLLKKKRNLFAAVVAVLLALLVYSWNLRNREQANFFEKSSLTVSSPLLGVVSGAGRGVFKFWDDYITLVGVSKENRVLKESVRQLNGRVVASQDAVLENERLKKLLALKSSVRLPAVAASVIGEEGVPWYRTILIDRGQVDGIVDGMPVVATAGVVGRVVKTAPGSSRVLLLTDHASSIAAMVQRSRARGVLKGRGGNICSLEFATREDDVKVGDIVTASGVGGVFQKGTVIGEVTMVRKGEYGMFQTIDVRPAVNLSHLEEVLVLLHQGG